VLSAFDGRLWLAPPAAVFGAAVLASPPAAAAIGLARGAVLWRGRVSRIERY
jgi:hypothetical protein